MISWWNFATYAARLTVMRINRSWIGIQPTPFFSHFSVLKNRWHSNPGVRLGGAEVADPNEMMAAAVQLAKEADVVIAVVGLNADWETEGYDRTTLALPGRTDELISSVAAANPKTIVVTEAVSYYLCK